MTWKRSVLNQKRSVPRGVHPFSLKKSLVFVWWNGRKFILLHRNQASIVSNDGEIRKRERYKARARNRFRIVICLNFDSRPTYIVGRSFYILCSVLPISPLFRTFANESLPNRRFVLSRPLVRYARGDFFCSSFYIGVWLFTRHAGMIWSFLSQNRPKNQENTEKSKVILTFSVFFLAYIKLTLYLCSVIIKQTLLLTLQN